MRRSVASAGLSLLLLALFVGAGLWLLPRDDVRPEGEARPGATVGPTSPADATGGSAATSLRDAPSPVEAPTGSANGAGAALSGEPREPISIEGRVTDTHGEGVAGARVVALGRAAWEEELARSEEQLSRAPLQALRARQESLEALARALPTCVTGEDGAYALRGLADGDHRVVVTHPELLPHSDGDWLLVERARTVRHDVELLPGLAITGLALDEADRPIAGARASAVSVEKSRLKGLGKLVQVFIEQTEGDLLLAPREVETDTAGAFRIPALQPGSYDLRVTKAGRAWGEAHGVIAGSEDIKVKLGPAFVVTGRVLSPTKEPVATAKVTLREPARDLSGPQGPMAVAYLDLDLFGTKELAAGSDAEGRFRLDAFTPGEYVLLVSTPGFPVHEEPIAFAPPDSRGRGGAPPEPSRGGGGSLDLGDIVLAEGRELTGTVLGPDGLPVAGAEVWAPQPPLRAGDPAARRDEVLEVGPASSAARGRADSRGAFRLVGLREGAWEVAVLAAGYPGALRAGVEAGGPAVTIVLERGVTVRGLVIDAESGAPLEGVRVEVHGSPPLQQATDADGRFEVAGARFADGATFGGSLGLGASLEGYRETHETVAFPDLATTPCATVRLELRRTADQGASPNSSVRGVVLDSRGQPIANARVVAEVPGWPRAFLRMEPGGDKSTRSAPDGSFTIRAPHFGGKVFEVAASSPGLAPAHAGPFPQDPGESGWPSIVLVLEEGTSIEGRVTSATGAPIEGACVRIWREAAVPEEETLATRILPPQGGQRAYTGPDGAYRMGPIEPGAYKVSARAPGFAQRTLGPFELGGGASAAVGTGDSVPDAAPSRGSTSIDIVLEPGGSIQGRVIDSDGLPLAGIEVVLIPAPDASEAAAASLVNEDAALVTGALGAASTLTGPDGIFGMDHVTPGAFLVLARAPGFELAAVPFVVSGSSAPDAFGTEDVPDLVLERHARILGQVRDAVSGAPVPVFALRLERKVEEAAGSRGDSADRFVEDGRQGREVVDARGRFVCAGVRAGKWRIHVRSGAHTPWQGSMLLAAGEEAELAVALSPGARIDGVVTNPDGAPIAGATIDASRIGDGRGGEERDLAPARSGEDGCFSIAGLEEGSYRLQASHPDHYREGAEGASVASLSPGQSATARLVLRPAGKVLGRIRGIRSAPTGDDFWGIVFTPLPSGQPFQEWTDATGAFDRSSLRPGTYRLELVHRRRGPETGGEWVSSPPVPRPLGEVEVRGGEAVSFEGDAGE